MDDNKYIIRVIETEKWLTVDFYGCDLVYLDELASAYRFKTIKEAELFVIDMGLKLEDCELYKIKIFAQSLPWA